MCKHSYEATEAIVRAHRIIECITVSHCEHHTGSFEGEGHRAIVKVIPSHYESKQVIVKVTCSLCEVM